jgi:hypothetical protein
MKSLPLKKGEEVELIISYYWNRNQRDYQWAAQGLLYKDEVYDDYSHGRPHAWIH